MALARRLHTSLTPSICLPKTARAASVCASRQCVSTVSVARRLARSPDSRPPMPSERTNRFSSGASRKLSSLFSRTRPVSLRAPASIARPRRSISDGAPPQDCLRRSGPSLLAPRTKIFLRDLFFLFRPGKGIAYRPHAQETFRFEPFAHRADSFGVNRAAKHRVIFYRSKRFWHDRRWQLQVFHFFHCGLRFVLALESADPHVHGISNYAIGARRFRGVRWTGTKVFAPRAGFHAREDVWRSGFRGFRRGRLRMGDDFRSRRLRFRYNWRNRGWRGMFVRKLWRSRRRCGCRGGKF